MWKAAISLIDQIRGKRGGEQVFQDSLDPGRIAELRILCDKINYRFKNFSVLEQALTHSSYSYEQQSVNPERPVSNYESMEFLGDSILGLIISEFLYLSYPEKREGFLSKIKSQMVSTNQLSELSKSLELGNFLNLGKGEMKTGGGKKKAILADLFESLLAAIYLDGGFEEAREFVLRSFKPYFEELARGEFQLRNSKSALQEKLHEMDLEEPSYRIVSEEGPQHQKEFVVEASIRDEVLSTGTGSSKKAAEQDAAKNALFLIRQKEESCPEIEPVDEKHRHIIDSVD